MGKAIFQNQTEPSTTPSTGFTDLYVDIVDKHVKTKDDAGTIVDLTGENLNEFTELTDTFSSYSGLGGKHLKVNTGATAIDTGQALDTTNSPSFVNLTLTGDLTVQGTTTTIDTTTLLVEDKNIEIGNVTTPTDLTADGGGITLKASTDITITWLNATNAWTFNQSIDLLGNNLITTGTVNGGRVIVDNLLLDANTLSSTSGDLDVTTATGGVFKFTSTAIRAGLDAVEYVEMGHGGGNGFINAVGDGGLDIRFEGATLATFTDFGHLHLQTNVDQKHTLKIITNNNLNDTGIAWENSGGSFTHTIFRTDVGTNRADLVFAAGLNSNIDLLTNSFKIHGEASDEGKLEVLGKFQISSGSPAAGNVLTTLAGDGIATWEVPQSHGWTDDGTVVRLTTSNDSVGIGISTPDGKLHVHSGTAGSVTANSSVDNLVVESSGSSGMSILVPDASTGRIVFGSPGDNFGAALGWSFSSNDFFAGPSKVGANFRLLSDQETTNLTLSGASGSELATFAKDVTINGVLSGLTQLTVDNIDINGNTISVTNVDGDLILDALGAGTGVVKVTDQLIIEGSTSQLQLTDTDNDKTYILKSNLGDFSIVEIGGNNVFKIRTGAAVNSLDINSTEVTIGTKLIVDNLSLDGNTISSTDLNGNINLSPDGTGSLAVSTTAIIGSTSLTPDGTLHVHIASAGSVTANPVADGIVVEDSTNTGISILTPDASVGRVIFGSPSDPFGAQMTWSFSGSDFVVGTSKIGASFRLTGDLETTNLTLSGASGSELANFAKDVIVNGQIKIVGGSPGESKVLTSDAVGLSTWEVLIEATVQETFASTNVRFFGELGLPAAQGWTDTATGSATIDLFIDNVFGETKQVVRHNDNVTNGSTTTKILLTAQNWIDINNFGASYSGISRLDTVNGASGFFSGLQANAAENPLVTGNRRYGILFDSVSGNLQLIEADNNPGNSVTMDGTSGNPLIPFDEFFRWECVVPAGLGAAQVFINGILTTFVPTFIVNGGGLGTQIIVGSGSTSGANRVSYHDNFGVTIYEESATKTLAVITMDADVAQINIPEGRRDYIIILPDGNPRDIGDVLRIVANNVFGNITLKTQSPSAPEVIYNGLRTLVIDVFVKEIIEGINTVDQDNVYIGFKAEDIDRSASIFAQLSSNVDQLPIDTNPTIITYNTQDEIGGLTHSTTVNSGEITIDTEGVYFVSPQPQVGKSSGGVKVDFDMFWQIDRGSGFIDEPNSNVKLVIKDSDITDVVVSAFAIPLNIGDKIRMMQKVSDSSVGMGLKNTDPVVGPPTVPRTPSIILTMYRVGGI